MGGLHVFYQSMTDSQPGRMYLIIQLFIYLINYFLFHCLDVTATKVVQQLRIILVDALLN